MKTRVPAEPAHRGRKKTRTECGFHHGRLNSSNQALLLVVGVATSACISFSRLAAATRSAVRQNAVQQNG